MLSPAPLDKRAAMHTHSVGCTVQYAVQCSGKCSLPPTPATLHMTTAAVSPDHEVAAVGHICTAFVPTAVQAIAAWNVGLAGQGHEHLFLVLCQLFEEVLVNARDLLDGQLLAWLDVSWQLQVGQVSFTPCPAPEHPRDPESARLHVMQQLQLCCPSAG